MARKFTLTTSVADLRKEPLHLPRHTFAHHPLRLSQLLYNERLNLLEARGEWLYVAALEQLRYTEEKGWHPYPGWVHHSEVCEVEQFPKPIAVVSKPALKWREKSLAFGTYLTEQDMADINDSTSIRPLSLPFSTERLREDAYLFVGAPYLWGGRGSYPAASVDCSGLIDLLYRAQGISIPRDACDQHRSALPKNDLLPGNPLYLAKEGKAITHVILQLDERIFIEAPETGKSIRLLTYGKDIRLESGQIRIYDRPHLYHPFSAAFIK